MDEVTESRMENERKSCEERDGCLDAWQTQNGTQGNSSGRGKGTAVNGVSQAGPAGGQTGQAGGQAGQAGGQTGQCKRENGFDRSQCSFMDMMNSGLGQEDQTPDGNQNFRMEGQGHNVCSPCGPYSPVDQDYVMSFYGHRPPMHHPNPPRGQFENSYQGGAFPMGRERQLGFPCDQSRFHAGPPWQIGHPYPQGQMGGMAQNLSLRQSYQSERSASFPLDRSIKQEVDSTMSLWAKTQQLSAESLKQVQNAYGTQFPLEVRHFFAQWIEEQPWRDIDENNPGHEQFALQLLSHLLTLMEARAEENDMDFLAKLNLRNTAKHFKEWYSDNPMNLVRIVKTCLATEEALVNKETSHPDSMEHQDLLNDQYIYEEIKKTILVLEERTDSTEQDLRRMQMDQEKFVIDYQKNLKIANQLTQLKQIPQDRTYLETEKKLKAEKDEMDKQLIAAAQQLLQQRIELASKHKETLTLLDSLQKRVVDDELIKWKRHQQLAGNGAEFDHTRIDTIQNWCEALAQLIWKNRRGIIQVDMLRNQLPINIPPGIEDIQPELNKIVTGLLSSLVTSTFIVEHQPPQVLKKDARFTATVRLLVGGKLNLQMTPPRVKATIISEQQARGLLQSDEGRRTQKCGEILNNEAPMDYHQHSGQLSILFRNMSLKNIKRADRRGADVHCVAEEKFCILFSSDFNVGGNELNFQVWTLSLPVVVTVHGNQECQATATYLWDNQFSESGRTPFMVPDIVPWREFAQMLSTKFQSMTGRGLSDSNLKYLAHKLLGYNGTQDLNQMSVSWTQFNKENLPGRNFTFWEWFWSIGKLVKEHLRGPWNDGCIHGFIEKNESQELLMSRPNGTFLLRFSDGTLGGVTIAWVADHEIAGERQVWNLHPFTIKDFSIRGLADRVKDLKSLITLFPDIPKDASFRKYYTPMPEPSAQPPGAYVKTTLITVIDQPRNAAPMNIDDPQTPQAYNEPFSPGNLAAPHTPKGDAASLVDSLMHEESADFQVASPDNALDLDFSRLNEFLENHTG